jgi:multidrug efflux pump subunit AcrB
MIVSYVAAQTLVPVLSNKLLKTDKYEAVTNHAGLMDKEGHIENAGQKEKEGVFQRIKRTLASRLEKWMPKRKSVVLIYLLIAFAGAGTCFVIIGKDLLPVSNVGQLQLRIREPDGTRLTVTEAATRGVLRILDSTVDHHIQITSAYVGLVPSSFGTSNLYIFNSGTQEAVIQVELEKKYTVNIEDLKEKLRHNILRRYPELHLSFEPIELTAKIMSQGASTPIEVQVAGKNMSDIEQYADRLVDTLKRMSILRDVQIAQPLKYPVVNIKVDRERLSTMGLTIDDVSRSITDVTSSSRFTSKNLWLDQKDAYTYQTQVEVPEYMMTSVEELKASPLIQGQMRPVLEDVASISLDTLPGEYDRSGPRRFVTVSANTYKRDLGSATTAVQAALGSLGTPPTGLVPEIKACRPC